MGKLTKPAPVKLVIGLLAGDTEFMERARAGLSGLYGIEEEVLSPIPFTWTNYYQREVGSSPLRCFVSYEDLIDREQIVGIKLETNRLEEELSMDGLRPVNIDPGYLTLGQFFLATTKDQRQRVYLGRGVFAEVSLFFKDGKFHTFPWTYRDYQSAIYHDYFLKARSRHAYQLKHGRPFSQRKGG